MPKPKKSKKSKKSAKKAKTVVLTDAQVKKLAKALPSGLKKNLTEHW